MVSTFGYGKGSGAERYWIGAKVALAESDVGSVRYIVGVDMNLIGQAERPTKASCLPEAKKTLGSSQHLIMISSRDSKYTFDRHCDTGAQRDRRTGVKP